MKTILYILFAATMMAGCNNSKATKGFDSVDATRFATRRPSSGVILLTLQSVDLMSVWQC